MNIYINLYLETWFKFKKFVEIRFYWKNVLYINSFMFLLKILIVYEKYFKYNVKFNFEKLWFYRHRI